MAIIKIGVPDLAQPSTEISLSGIKYNFLFHYSTVESCYYLDIYSQDELILGGIKLIEGLLTFKYDLPLFPNGELLLVKLKETSELPSRNNVGIGKAYELIYIETT